MKTRLLAAALALSALLSPGLAEAAHRAKAHAGPSYPMKADEFKALVEKRIDKVREAIDKKLDRAGVTPDRKKAIHKTIDDVAKPIRAEAAKAAADGTVTQAEADKVKTLTTQLRGHVRERLRAETDPKKAEAARKTDAHDAAKGAKSAKAVPEPAKTAKAAPGAKPAPAAKPSKPGPNKAAKSKSAPGKSKAKKPAAAGSATSA